MAATVIDRLVVELGLDPRGIEKGRKEAAASLLKTRDDAERAGKDMERAGKQAAQFYSQLRTQVIELFAAFTGGRGIKDIIEDTVLATAALGRMARTLDTNVETLSTWRGMAVLAGGTAEGMANSVRTLTQQFQNFALTGDSSVLPYFRALRVNIADANGKMRPFQDIFMDLADRFHSMDPARAFAFGSAMGYDEGTINLLILGRKALQDLQAEQLKLGIGTKADAEASIQLQHAWAGLGLIGESFSRTIVRALAPALEWLSGVMLKIGEWAQQHGAFVQGVFYAIGAALLFLGAAALAPIAEILAIAAAIIGLGVVVALLYDDWKTFTEGGRSEFGSFWKVVTAAFRDIYNTGRAVIMLLRALFVGSSADIRKAWGDLMGTLWKDAVDFFTGGVPNILNAIKAAWGAAFQWIEDRANAVWGAITGHRLTGPHGDATGVVHTLGSALTTGGAWAAAIATQVATGVPAAVTFAQYQLESGAGRHMPAGSNNPFGIKAHAGQDGVWAWTDEVIDGVRQRVQQRFAKFGSLQEAFTAHAQLLAHGAAYAGARAAGSDPLAFAGGLGAYATDPGYVAKLQAIIRGLPNAKPSGGASPAALAATTFGPGATNIPGSTSSHSSEVSIDRVIINTRATDAGGIARDFGEALRRDQFAQQANFGPN